MTQQNDFRKTWDIYSNSWKGIKLAERLTLFKECLTPDCSFSNPLGVGEGWDALGVAIEEFQRDVPGGSFETIEYISHHHTTLVKWHMKNGENQKLSEGYSVAEYNSEGKIFKLTGFWQQAN